MITIEFFKFEDYAEIEKANDSGLELCQLSCGVFPVLYGMEKSKTWWTVRRDGRILFICGFFALTSNVCEVSLFPSVQFTANPCAGFRTLKKMLLDRTKGFLRVQMTCELKFREWGRHLGFSEEGILRKFGKGGCDHVIMAMVR